MRKFVPLAAAIASATVVALPMMSADAAVTHVLTIKKVGGPAVRAGAVLKAHLVTGTKAVFSLGNGSEKLKCKSSKFAATVRSNPAKPGKATESLTAISTAKCAFSPIITGVTFKSITAKNLPYKVTVSDAAGLPVTVSETSTTMPIKFTVKLAAGTTTIKCNYKAASVTGAASNTGSTIAFSKQKFTKAAGSNSLCVGPAFFSATYGPVRDISVTNSPKVFVN
jgi:hypothetical protein